ncbi:hypothetical protein HJFPF1_07814 [Paramyrothecium foliicola]|nr:hypothetical protein HJFPF1_07814 [Paramyrothecium foliicola]
MNKHKSKHKDKGKSHRRHEESGQAEFQSIWKWDDNAKDWYRPHEGPDGTIHYEWAAQSTDVTGHDSKPRHSHSSSVDRITEGFASLSHETYEAQQDDGYTLEPGSKGKGKAVPQEYSDEQYNVADGSYNQAGSYSQEGVLDGNTGPSPGNTSADVYEHETPIRSFASPSQPASYGDPYTTGNFEPTTGYSDDSPEVLAAVAGYNYDAYSAGIHPATGEPSAMGTAYDYDDYEPGEGAATPRPTKPDDELELFNELAEEGLLDSRYCVQPSSAFQPGAIFKIYWPEPEGHSKDDAVSLKQSYENKLGVKFYYGIRRFVVIANDQGHASVVPVLTYGRRACKKKGVKPEKHGIIYQHGQKARLLDREPRLGFAPVRAVMTVEGETLAKESRINYSKLTAVEHNFRVLFIGSIHSADWDIVSEAVNECWNAKIHHKKKHRR